MDAIAPPHDHRHLVPLPVRKADSIRLLLLLLGGKTSLKILGFRGAEVVAAADDVGSVRVVGGVERNEEGEHLRRVPAATEDDEEVGW